MEPEGSLPYSQQSTTCFCHGAKSIQSISPSNFLKIHFNIMLPCAPRYSNCLLSQRFPHQNPVCTSPLLYTCYMTRPFHSSGFGHPNIWREVQIVKFLIIYSFPLPSYLVPPRPKYLPQHPVLESR